MLTTAGVTFLTISEKPCASDGGTAASAGDDVITGGRTAHPSAMTTATVTAANPAFVVLIN
jgi:hypothetical protein